MSLRIPLAMLVVLSCFGLRLATAHATTPDAGAPEAAAEVGAQASNATLSQNFNAPESAAVGDRLALTLEVRHPLNTTAHLPEAFPNPRWEVASREHQSLQGDADITTTFNLVFQIFRPGETTLPAFDVTVLQADGSVEKLATEPVSAKVLSVLPSGDTPELAAPRNPVAVWTDDYTILWVGGGLLALLIAGGVGFFINRRNQPDAPAPPPRPAHLVALEKLSALTPGDLLDSGDYMLFYVRMSEAIREYLGRRYHFRGTELTTTEILGHLNAVESGEGWPKGISYEDVRDWLNYCDLIKFSDMTPARERSEQLLRQAFSMVELTHVRAPQTDAQAEVELEVEVETNTEQPGDAPTEVASSGVEAPESPTIDDASDDSADAASDDSTDAREEKP